MNFRAGVLIGVLATAVVALGVAVIVLANDGSGNSTTIATTTGNEACPVSYAGGKAKIDLASSSLTCDEAKSINTTYERAVGGSSRATDIYQTERVVGWGCQTYPFSEYPVLVRCQHGTRRFDVVGLAPDAHRHQAPVRPSTSRSAESVVFQTPTGNIGCRIASTSVRCDIFNRSWSPPPKPENCEFSWGHSVELHRSGSTFLCADDAVITPGGESGVPVLHYGKAVGEGQFACESREQALVCVAKSGHGFLLSFQKLKLF